MATQSPDGYLNALKKYQSKNKEDALTIINNQLKKTPEAKIDQIIVQNTKGQVLVNAMASLGGPEAKLDNLENYFMLLMMAKSSGELMIDETVFDYLLEEQSRETASALPKEFWVQQQTTEEKWVSDNVTKLKEEAVKTGVFIKEGKKMISRFKYENSNFTINGKTIKDIVAMHAELNKPKPEPVPTPVAPAAAVAPSTTAPSVGTAPLPAQAAPVTPPQSQAIANNPNDPAKPSEPMPISEVKELPKVEGATPIPPPQPSPASEGGSVMVQPGESHR